jgi:hypothetical protein
LPAQVPFTVTGFTTIFPALFIDPLLIAALMLFIAIAFGLPALIFIQVKSFAQK